jgi:hypothetical protein
MKLSKNRIISAVFIVLSLILCIKVLKINVLERPFPISFIGLDARVNFSPSSINHFVQVNYYSELTKGISEGLLGFSVLPDSELLAHKNPYGEEAARLGLILQDASLYKGRYYLYYGLPPVILLYLPILKIFGFIPTDALVITILAFIYILILTIVSINISIKSAIYGFLLYFCFLFNPTWLYALNFVVTAGVARLFCDVLLLMAYLLIAKNLYVDSNNKKIIIILALLATAAFTRPTFLPDFFILSALLIYLNFRNNLKNLIIGFIYPATGFLLNFYYNHLRFDSIFENGQKYIVNGGDYVHKGIILQFPKYLFNSLYNFFYRLYENFLSFPTYDAGGIARLNFSTKSPMLPGAYTEGVLGYFIFNPTLPLLCSLAIFSLYKLRNKINIKEKLLFYVAFFLLIFNLFAISLLQMSSLQFILEYIPRLFIVVAISIFLCINHNSLYLIKNNLIKFLLFLSLILPFQLALVWRSF